MNDQRRKVKVYRSNNIRERGERNRRKMRKEYYETYIERNIKLPFSASTDVCRICISKWRHMITYSIKDRRDK